MTNSARALSLSGDRRSGKAIAETIADSAGGRWTGWCAAMSASARPKWPLRAAFVAAMAGEQVAVVVPTTLLARQHYRGFAERFAGFPRQSASAFAICGYQGGK